MKNRALFSTLLLTVALMVLAGCDPTLSYEGGRKVKFSANSQASPATKTAYYGNPSDGWQTISWKVGDKICIYAPAGGSISGTPVNPSFGLNYVYANYTVKNFGNGGHLSKGSLDNVDENGLIWSGSGDAVFYAAYPGDVVKIATNNHNQLRFYFEIPNTQDGKPEFISKLPLLSKQTVGNGEDVVLDFYPAFSAFEFIIKSEVDETFTIDWVELDTEATDFPLTGACYYDLNALPDDATDSGYPHFVRLRSGDITSSRIDTSIKFNLGATISKTQEASITFFTLPIDYTGGLKFKVQCSKTANGGTETTIRTLNLKYDAAHGGNWLKFKAGHKAVFTGVAVEPDLWCFKTITLEGKVIEITDWDTNGSFSTTSGVNPEASQFAITGAQNMYQIHNNADAYKAYRQRWILPDVNSIATVNFKIMSPAGGTYTVTPQGEDVSDFTIMSGETEITAATPLTGSIASSGGATKVTFTVKPKASAVGTTKKVWFTTTVKAADGTVFNIDSETQLYDMRGYHYFMTQEQTADF